MIYTSRYGTKDIYTNFKSHFIFVTRLRTFFLCACFVIYRTTVVLYNAAFAFDTFAT